MERNNRTTRVAPSRATFALAATVAAFVSAGAANSAEAQTCIAEEGNACGFVWNDANNNGVQDDGENGIENVTVTFTLASDSTVSYTATTGVCDGASLDCGIYKIFIQEPGVYNVSINPTSIDQGTVATAPNDQTYATEDTDSDGVPNAGDGVSVVTNVELTTYTVADNDFGFYTPPQSQQVGTGTPGYWKNHPDAWPVSEIVMGGQTYSVGDAISVLGKVSKDKSITMFSSLLAAKLNVANGTTPDCITGTIEDAEKWLANNPVGSNVTGASPAWRVGEPLHKAMDAYNNGLMCAPHRN